MEKDQGFSGNSSAPTAPPPTAPPSYEEAIASAGGAPHPMAHTAPYPTSVSSMPMPGSAPGPYGQISMPMPQPQTNMHQNRPQYTAQPYGAPQAYAAPPEVRVVELNRQTTYALGPNPVKMSCPTCQADIKTTTVSDHQPSAHICCIVLCLLGCCLCSCLPYCMSAFMSVHHSCPNCKTYIGTWKG